MELYSTKSDPRNADLLDSSGYAVYRITTDSSFGSSGTTAMSRMVATPKGEPQPVIIATIEWHFFSSNIFRLRGLTLKDNQFIRGSGAWTR